MKTLSITLSEALDARLSEEAERRQVDRAELVRDALEAYLEETEVRPNGGADHPGSEPKSFYESIKDLAGCIEGPGDLSYNPKYMEEFGES